MCDGSEDVSVCPQEEKNVSMRGMVHKCLRPVVSALVLWCPLSETAEEEHRAAVIS